MRVDASVQVNIPVSNLATSEAKIFSDLKQGDSVNAKVLSVKGNEVILKTDDGSVIKAEFAADTPVKPGDTLQLMLSSQGQKNIDLKLVAINNEPLGLHVNITEAALLRMGVEPSQTNVRLAQILQSQGFLPTEKNIANLAKIASQFPDLDSKLATFMASNNIAPTEKNINALLQIIQNPKGLSQDLQALTQFAKENLSANASVSSASEKLFTNSFISNLFSSSKSVQTAEQIVSQPNFMSFMEDLQGMSKADAKTAIKNFVNNSNIPNKQEAIALLTAAFEQTESVDQSSKAYTPADKATPQNTFSEKAAQAEVTAKQGNTQASQGSTQTPQDSTQVKNATVDSANSNTTTAKPSGEGTAQKAENPVSAAQTNSQPVESKSATVQQNVQGNTEKSVLNNANIVAATSIPQEADSPLTAAVKLLGAINKLFSPLGTQASGQEIHENIKDQLNLLSSIKGNTAKLSGETSVMNTRADNALTQAVVTSNFDNFYYCQIPFQYNNTKNSAELFVFEKNKGKEDLSEKTNITVLIALETQNMGRVETVMRSENNILNLEIRVADQGIKKFIQDNAHELKEELSSVNFDAKEIKVKLLTEITTPLNAQNIVNPNQKIALSGIDIQV